MSINKLSEFAVNGDKSISGLTLTTGFPRQQKPYRQWMNYLFNMVTAKTNQLVDAVNALDAKIEPLLKPIAVGEGFFTVNDYQSASEVAAAKGYGTWQRFAEGKTLVGYSASTSTLDAYRIMGNEFGEDTHTLTVNETPSHKHSPSDQYNKFVAVWGDWTDVDLGKNTPVFTGEEEDGEIVGKMPLANWNNAKEKSIGGGKSHNNIQPSIVVAYWIRTA